jgi:hypothetical protein
MIHSDSDPLVVIQARMAQSLVAPWEVSAVRFCAFSCQLTASSFQLSVKDSGADGALFRCSFRIENEAGLIEAVEEKGANVGPLVQALVAAGTPAVTGVAVGADENEMLVAPLSAHHGDEFGGLPGIDAIIVEADAKELVGASLSAGQKKS